MIENRTQLKFEIGGRTDAVLAKLRILLDDGVNLAEKRGDGLLLPMAIAAFNPT